MPNEFAGLTAVVCGKCNGGTISTAECWICFGSGVLYSMSNDGIPLDRDNIDRTLVSIHCPKCQPHRSEYEGSEGCDLCNGFGTVFRQKEVGNAR